MKLIHITNPVDEGDWLCFLLMVQGKGTLWALLDKAWYRSISISTATFVPNCVAEVLWGATFMPLWRSPNPYFFFLLPSCFWYLWNLYLPSNHGLLGCDAV